jgi:integrase
VPRIQRNQLKIDRARCVDGRRTVYRVEGVPGLELDVQPSGKRTWRVRYQVGKGASRSERRYTIGDARSIGLGPATEKAREVFATVQLERRDPHADRVRDDLSTFGALFDLWLERHAKPNKKSWQADAALYKRHVKARLSSRPIAVLKKRDYVEVLDSIMLASSGSQANAAQSIITAALNWAENEGIIDSHAARGIPKRQPPKTRDRVLSPTELQRWWQALETEVTPRQARVLRVLLFTGVRLSEACGMAKAEIQGDLWEIPGARTKSGLPHVVPLTPPVAELVASAIAESGESPFVFPAFDRRRMMKKPINRHAPDHAYAKLARKLGFTDADGAVNTGVHDLRRTVATNMARIGVPGDLIDRVQGRLPRGNRVSAIYNRHDYLLEKRAALEQWAAELAAMVSRNDISRIFSRCDVPPRGPGRLFPAPNKTIEGCLLKPG